MKFAGTTTGFVISDNNNTKFVFLTDSLPNEENGLLKLNVGGKVPVPVLESTDRLILPVDEGIAIEVGKEYDKGELNINHISGRFMSREATMSMVIIERCGSFLLICMDNGLEAKYDAVRTDGMYTLEIVCERPHTVTYGVYYSLAEACKAYKSIKSIKKVSLSEKIQKNPEIEKLMGGIFWLWSERYNEVMYAPHDTDVSPLTGDAMLEIAADMKANGVDDAMFGIFFEGDSKYTQPLYERYGYLSTQYDNYNDVLNPELLSKIPNNRVNWCDYTYRRMKDYPQGIIVDEDGSLARAWALRGFDGTMYSQNTLCPQVACERIREEIPQILRKYPYYKGRFIDVYGGSVPACHSEEHPVTVDECLEIKKTAFNFLGDIGLIAGTEDGFEDLVDSLVYTEGLHSPVYFRIEDAGRNHANQYTTESENHIRKNMLDPTCRVPLWHLVYHDSLLAFPYWGDTTERGHETVQDKVLYACLFGCPPLYSFMTKDYEKIKPLILDSYKKIHAVMSKVGTLEMTDYAVLTDDYMVQACAWG